MGLHVCRTCYTMCLISQVPPCDIFELRALPTLCSDKDVCVNLEEQGCYLAYVRRKVTSWNHMNYADGLFGGCAATIGKSYYLRIDSSQRKDRTIPPAQSPNILIVDHLKEI